ncbi:MAG: hypothetical protein H3C31_01675 [Brumimicrobium sp.]|nr:hypothetical protein [Brumimicrobium sp.]
MEESRKKYCGIDVSADTLDILYMCAMNAMQNNRSCKELYQRLISKGKNGKVAIIAVCNNTSINSVQGF